MDTKWENRRGKFRITECFMDDDPYGIFMVLQTLEFIPLNVSFAYDRRIFTYTGLSPMFDVVLPSFVTPLYTIQAQRFPNGTTEYSVSKCDPEPEEKPRRRIRL